MKYRLSILGLVVILLLVAMTGWALEIDDQLQAEQAEIKELEKAHVARVIDGDTIKTADQRTIRLIGVDTPETKHPSKPVEYYGKQATKFTKHQLAGKTIYLEYDVQKRDQYDRILAYIFKKDGTFFNAQLLHDGYAKLLTIPPNVQYINLFTQLIEEAREEKRGLWEEELLQENEELPLVSWQEAREYIGQRVRVKGEVVSTYDSGEAVFLNFAEDYEDTFTAVIFASDKYKFEVNPAEFYLHKSVRVRGKVKQYKGAPEIIVKTPQQIKIKN